MQARTVRRFLYLAGFIALLVFLLRREEPGGLPMAHDRLGFLTIAGVITTSEELVDDIELLASNPHVRGLVLRVDSPGGGVAPSQEIHDALVRFQGDGDRPVVVSMGNVAASGGYYVSCGAEKIVANAGTLTGSIGVIMHFTQFHDLLDRLGVHAEAIKTGAFKDIGSPTREMTDEERALLEGVLDDVHGQFVAAIVEGRGMPEEVVRALADGRIFSGQQAKERGLVDELGGLHDAIRLAGDLTGLGPEPELLRPQESGVRRLRELIDGSTVGRLFAAPGLQGLCFLYRY
ncbi:MAG: signal peptide peptidase SppA [Nitrospirota bacterium]|jgi:protease-4